jgi:hypothetical protein
MFIFDHIVLLLYSLYNRASSQRGELHHSHWSHRVTADNPHGFTDTTLARFRAIEDPAEREKEERRMLMKRAATALRKEDAAYRQKQRDYFHGHYQKKKIDAGYVGFKDV